ncbi:MAG: SMC family ATPase [Synechococcaceae cyanobacterium]|nr:SMC family ATPase [Synechococcaceae cyanobacterium]
MRPHRLRIEAFGPYAEPAEIGFDVLAPDGVFLIHGSTGAGKTYLLDALCFALYGEVSGDRGVKGLRSDHAPAGAVPRVELEFSAAGGRWRVERTPAHEAPRTRGTGTTQRAPKAALFRIRAGEEAPVATGLSEVHREIVRIVGLDGPRFRQVILLPQGRFAEVLRARPEERETLLKTLFDTTLYERAGFWLEERAKAAHAAVLEGERSLSGLREQAALAWSPWAEGEDPPGSAEPQGQEDLERMEERSGAVEQACAEGLRRAAEELERGRALQAEAERLAERWDRRRLAREKLERLEQRGAAIEALRRQSATAERAERLRPSLQADRQAREQVEGLRGRIGRLLAAARRAREEATSLPDALVALDLLRPPDAEALARAVTALAVRREELEGLARLEADARAARGVAGAARREAKVLEERVAKGQALLVRRQADLGSCEERLARVRSARDRLDGLVRAEREAAERLALVEALEGARRAAEAARAASTAAEGERNGARARLLTLRERLIAGMAARLASGLASGDPCPVCGSRQHPRPAVPSDDGVDDGAMAAAEAALEVATRQATTAAEAAARAQTALEERLARAGEAAGDPAASRNQAAAALHALGEARDLAARVEPLEQERSRIEADLQRFAAGIEELQQRRGREEGRAADAERRAAELEARVSAGVGGDGSPERALEGFAPLAEAIAELGRAVEDLERAGARAREAARRLAEDLAGSDFGDAAAAAAALCGAQEREEWQQTLRAHDEELLRQRGLLAAPELQELPGERPDTAAAAARAAAADAGRTAALERHTRARGAREAIARLAGLHRSGQEALEEKRRAAERLHGVADRCLGRTAPFISLQPWVLSAYLEEICGYANQRLELMTSGRYRLLLTDAAGRRGSRAGLGLRVLDAYTGEEREVASLSGGETFQASLALALGVADTVQAHAGGVALETLFIDEGFGTLDPDNLQLAMDELDRLREGGRMIGIISHVGALRERIRSGISVIASERGSRVVVGALGRG